MLTHHKKPALPWWQYATPAERLAAVDTTIPRRYNTPPALRPWWEYSSPAERLAAITAKADRGELELLPDDPARLPVKRPTRRRTVISKLNKLDKLIDYRQQQLKDLAQRRNILSHQL